MCPAFFLFFHGTRRASLIVALAHLNPVRALVVDAASAHDLREVVEDGPGGAGHLAQVAGLLPIQGRHVALLWSHVLVKLIS